MAWSVSNMLLARVCEKNCLQRYLDVALTFDYLQG